MEACFEIFKITQLYPKIQPLKVKVFIFLKILLNKIYVVNLGGVKKFSFFKLNFQGLKLKILFLL